MAIVSRRLCLSGCTNLYDAHFQILVGYPNHIGSWCCKPRVCLILKNLVFSSSLQTLQGLYLWLWACLFYPCVLHPCVFYSAHGLSVRVMTARVPQRAWFIRTCYTCKWSTQRLAYQYVLFRHVLFTEHDLSAHVLPARVLHRAWFICAC